MASCTGSRQAGMPDLLAARRVGQPFLAGADAKEHDGPSVLEPGVQRCFSLSTATQAWPIVRQERLRHLWKTKLRRPASFISLCVLCDLCGYISGVSILRLKVFRVQCSGCLSVIGCRQDVEYERCRQLQDAEQSRDLGRAVRFLTGETEED